MARLRTSRLSIPTSAKFARTAASCLALGAALALPSLARAHGGIPRAFSVVFEPGNPQHIALRSDVWGFFHSTDGGKTWQWVCAETYQGKSLSAEHRTLLLAPGGRVFVAALFDGLWSSGDICGWKKQPTFGESLVPDVALRGKDIVAMTSDSSNVTLPDGGYDTTFDVKLWQSKDGGETFTALGKALPKSLAVSNFAIAPSDPNTIYVTGRILFEDNFTVAHSADGGATWDVHPTPAQSESGSLRVAAIHPTDPNTMVAWLDLPEGSGENSPDEIWATADAGKNWKKVFSSTGDLPGFTFSSDAKKVFVAGPLAGLNMATTADALKTGQSAFKQTNADQFWGLAVTSEGLFAGTNQYRTDKKGFTFGVSKDDGVTFTNAMSLCAPGFASCGASDYESACSDLFHQTPGGFEADFQKTDLCIAPAADAGADAGSSGGSSGAGGTDAGGSSAGGSGGASEAATGGSGTTGGGDSGCSLVAPARNGRDEPARSNTAALLGLVALAFGRARRTRASR